MVSLRFPFSFSQPPKLPNPTSTSRRVRRRIRRSHSRCLPGSKAPISPKGAEPRVLATLGLTLSGRQLVLSGGRVQDRGRVSFGPRNWKERAGFEEHRCLCIWYHISCSSSNMSLALHCCVLIFFNLGKTVTVNLDDKNTHIWKLVF